MTQLELTKDEMTVVKSAIEAGLANHLYTDLGMDVADRVLKRIACSEKPVDWSAATRF